MNIRMLQAMVFWGSVFVCFGSTAYAQDYVETSVGKAMPMWLESAASVNDDGDIAWTHYDYTTGVATAKAVIDDNELTLDPGLGVDDLVFEQSYATAIASDGAVIGWGANNERLSIREAKLWLPGTSTPIDLHEEITSGYRVSVADRIAKDGSTYVIAGWIRKKTGKSDLPEAHIWTVDGGNVQGDVLHGGANATSAFARGVAEPDENGSVWVCGSAAATGTYNQATCWDVDQQNPNPIFFSELSTYASSSVEQVRTLEVDGTKQSIMVGFATDTAGETFPIAYNLTTSELYEDLSLVDGGTGIVKDVALETWSDANDAHGPAFFGTMSTLPPLNISVDGPLDTLSHMTASYQTRLGDAVDDAWPVCKVDDGLNTSGDPQQVTTSVSPDGRYRLVWSSASNELLRLEKKAQSSVNLGVYVRDAEVRTERAQRKAYTSDSGDTPTDIQYFWAETPGTSINGTVLWSDVAGCEPFERSGAYNAESCDPFRTFDLGGDVLQALNFESVNQGTARTLIATDALPSSEYVQVALQGAGDVCDVSPVMHAETHTRRNDFSQQSNEGAYDWADCSLSQDVEYDTDLNTSLDHCGSCTHECVTAHNDSRCNEGTCEIIECDDGWVDLNGVADDGCECQDHGDDTPDLTAPFEDTNCDGIDGDIENSIFVAKSGTDNGSCGTMAAPCLTIQQGIHRATSGQDVLVSKGTYQEGLILANGVSVYGGYDVDNEWSRSASHLVEVLGVVDSGHGWAVRGTNISAETILNQITLVAPAATSAGASSVGVACTNCNGLHVAYATVEAKAGRAGTNGANGGVKGADGNDDAQPGQGIGYASSDSNPMPGGTGGTSTCSANGGRGGDGGKTGNNAGSNGAVGQPTPRGGAVGAGGAKGSTCDENPGKPGGHGVVGQAGAHGSAGNGGMLSTTGRWGGADGGSASMGTAGGGGGGGGGGNGTGLGWGCVARKGGPGGGGGAGGCGGGAGDFGKAGGGSFAIILKNTTNALVRYSILKSANGGVGGQGKAGGAGGLGRDGGEGGRSQTITGGDPRPGGPGGNGAKGGDGGAGGGGAGGPSTGIMLVGGSTVSQTGNSFTLGTPGAGGTSPGNSGVAGCGANVCTVP